MMEHDKTECQAPPEHSVLCVNNCGFFGTAATMNMCSKCHKDVLLKQDQQAKLASAMMANSSTEVVQAKFAEPLKIVSVKLLSASASGSAETLEEKPTKEGPNRCGHCKKRVGFTGFKCRCGDFFCGSHRYSDKHDCQFDYRATAQDAIARANPVVKAEKVDKI